MNSITIPILNHEQLGFGSIKNSFMFVYLQISQAWALVLGLFDKQAELKQKKLFMNKLVDNRARYKTCWG